MNEERSESGDAKRCESLMRDVMMIDEESVMTSMKKREE